MEEASGSPISVSSTRRICTWTRRSRASARRRRSWRTSLREASLAAFDSLVELCLERRAAFLLIAGDIYDGPERGLRAQLRFRDGLARLSEAGIPSFVVHGNHDPVETGWSALSGPWPESVTVFASGAVQAVTVESDGIPLATVQGVSFAHGASRRT